MAKQGQRSSPRTEFKKGLIPWNKGETKETDPRIAEYGKKGSLTKKARHQAPTLEARAEGFRVSRGVKPTKPELLFAKFCEVLRLPLRYTGKGEIWIGNHNPDFIDCNGRKVVVEVLGNYWHKPEDVDELKAHYSQYGFQCIIFWESELKDNSLVESRLQKYGYKTFIEQAA